MRRKGSIWWSCLGLAPLLWASPLEAQPAAPGLVPPEAVLVKAIEGTNVWVLRQGAQTWTHAASLQFLLPQDRIRTGRQTRLTLLTPSGAVVRLPEDGLFEIPKATPKSTVFRLLDGLFYFFHRGEPTEVEILTRTCSATILGTEFVVAVDTEDRTTISMLHGRVGLTNALGGIALSSGEEGQAQPDRPPERTRASIETINVVQWFLYYPAILDPDELELDGSAVPMVRDSLAAYRRGDVLAAVAAYPEDRQPESPEESVYRAGLLLAVGQVDQSQALLEPLAGAEPPGAARSNAARMAQALLRMVATVKRLDSPALLDPRLATEWLAESYARQADGLLEEARAAAHQAVARSPGFGFGWVRLAELQFGFGEIRLAQSALRTGLALTPRNAQALALSGFLMASRNKVNQAITQFDAAIAVDPGLGNAWLGRGLCRMRLGESSLGLTDLEIAAALEPQRALLRSYLGKAYSRHGDRDLAGEELKLAQTLDAKDPTAWLYSALYLRQENRINEAVADLETSTRLNNNRRLYRSRLLLDQDRAVAGANLATLYQDAGMTDVSVREATRAVASDYANYSAHLFLANSYNQLRDPNQVNLRYETAWLSEYLVANLLAPVGAGTLSQTVSQQEYSKLFERDRLGLVSRTEYTSNGDWSQAAAQFGTYRNSGYALDFNFQDRNGQRPNNDFEHTTFSLQLKQELTAQDSLYLQALYYDAEGGDLRQVYDPDDPNEINPDVRVEETQEPLLLLGYHRQWSPEHHTLLLAARLEDTLDVTDPTYVTSTRVVTAVQTNTLFIPLDLDYQSELEIYNVEAQHIWQRPRHTVIAGARYQAGEFDTFNQLETPAMNTVISTNINSDMERFSAYGYYHWLIESWKVRWIAGLTYDWLTFPVNHRYPPVSNEEDSEDQLSPKAGLIWTPRHDTTLRAAYARTLGGVSFDQSFRLEPSQVAGHNQAFRSVIPESVAGSGVAAQSDLWAVELDQRLPTRTYWSLRGELLQSEADQSVGGFLLNTAMSPFPSSFSFDEALDYEEKTLTLTLNQLLNDEWALGTSYRLSQARLDDEFRDLPALSQSVESVLHQVRFFALMNHPSGFFGRLDSLWSQQSNHGYDPDRPGDDFWQFNAWAGYRLPRRRAELRVGLLNLTDQDYRLNPLNLTAELPRDRTFVCRFQFQF